MEEDDYWLSQKNWKALLNLVSNSNALKQAEVTPFSFKFALISLTQ